MISTDNVSGYLGNGSALKGQQASTWTNDAFSQQRYMRLWPYDVIREPSILWIISITYDSPLFVDLAIKISTCILTTCWGPYVDEL